MYRDRPRWGSGESCRRRCFRISIRTSLVVIQRYGKEVCGCGMWQCCNRHRLGVCASDSRTFAAKVGGCSEAEPERGWAWDGPGAATVMCRAAVHRLHWPERYSGGTNDGKANIRIRLVIIGGHLEKCTALDITVFAIARLHVYTACRTS